MIFNSLVLSLSIGKVFCLLESGWNSPKSQPHMFNSKEHPFLTRLLVRKGWVGRRTSNCLDLRPSHDYLLIAQLLRIRLQCRRPRFDSWLWKIRWRRDRLPTPVFLGFPCSSAGKESACHVVVLGSIPGLGRSPGKRKVYPLQYSGLEISMDCLVHGSQRVRVRHDWATFTHDYARKVNLLIFKLKNNGHKVWPSSELFY